MRRVGKREAAELWVEALVKPERNGRRRLGQYGIGRRVGAQERAMRSGGSRAPRERKQREKESERLHQRTWWFAAEYMAADHNVTLPFNAHLRQWQFWMVGSAIGARRDAPHIH